MSTCIVFFSYKYHVMYVVLYHRCLYTHIYIFIISIYHIYLSSYLSCLSLSYLSIYHIYLSYLFIYLSIISIYHIYLSIAPFSVWCIGGSGQDAPMEAPVTTTTAPVTIAPSSVVVGSKVATTTTASASPAKGVASHADHVLYEYNQQGQLLTNTTNFKEKMIMVR